MSTPSLSDWFTQLKQNSEQVFEACTEASKSMANGAVEESERLLAEAVKLTEANNEICERINSAYESMQDTAQSIIDKAKAILG